ncbi:hypothetical protein D3C75_1022440 [compost metagenome]
MSDAGVATSARARLGKRERRISITPHGKDVECHRHQRVISKNTCQLDNCRFTKRTDGLCVQGVIYTTIFIKCLSEMIDDAFVITLKFG